MKGIAAIWAAGLNPPDERGANRPPVRRKRGLSFKKWAEMMRKTRKKTTSTRTRGNRMKGAIKNFLLLLILAVVFLGSIFVYWGHGFLVFGRILAATLILAATIPKWVHGLIHPLLEDRCRQNEKEKRWDEETTKRNKEYNTTISVSLWKALFRVFLLGGLMVAVQYPGLDPSYQYGDFEVSVVRGVRFFLIISVVIFASKAVPIFIIKILHNFAFQLSSLTAKEKKDSDDEQDESGGRGTPGSEDETKEESEAQASPERDEASSGIKTMDAEDAAADHEKEEPEAQPKEDRDKAEGADEKESQAPECKEKEIKGPENVELYIYSFLRYIILIIGFAYAIVTLGLNLDTKLGIPGLEIVVQDLVNAVLAAVITVVFIVYFLPAILNIILGFALGLFSKRYRTEEERLELMKAEIARIRPGLERSLLYLILLMGVHATISALTFDESLEPSVQFVSEGCFP